LDIAGYISTNISTQYKMPLTLARKQKRVRRKTVKRKKDRRKSRRVWIYQKGNILYCFRIPYLRIIPSPVLPIHGGGAKENLLTKRLFVELKASSELQGTDNKIEIMLDSYKEDYDKETLVKGLMASMDKDTLKHLSDPKEKLVKEDGSLTDIGVKLLDWVNKRVQARSYIQYIINKNEMNYSPQELRDLEDMLNHKKPDSPGVLSSMTASTFSALESGTTFLGEFLTPLIIPGNNQKRENQSLIRFLWYPRSNIHYTKGESGKTSNVAKPNNPKYGDFMIFVEPEKYADTMTYLSSNFNSVEDFFTNVMNGCQDGLCKNGIVQREPYKEIVTSVQNFQPEFDIQDRTKKLNIRSGPPGTGSKGPGAGDINESYPDAEYTYK
jgi:hypothetical protein